MAQQLQSERELSSLTDLELVREVKAGRLEAFDLLAARVKRDIFLALWFNHIRNEADVEELTQLTLIRVYEKLAMFRDEGSFVWWVKSIARNIAIDHLRARMKDQKRFADVDLTRVRAAATLAPDRDLEARETDARLHAALEKQNPEVVDVLIDHLGGESYKEIADRTGKTEGSVKMSVKRLKDRLRKELEGKSAGGGR